MASSIPEQEFVEHVVDLLQIIGPVTSRRMFGGSGLFLEGLMLGILVDGSLYFKVDKQTINNFEEQGLEAFSYQRQGKTVSLSFHQAPEEVLEDLEQMSHWANLAYGAAVRSARKHR